MTPIFPKLYSRYGALTDAKPPSYVWLTFGVDHTSDLLHAFFRKLTQGVSGSSHSRSVGHLIRHIIDMFRPAQVFGIATRRVPASVRNFILRARLFPIGQRAYMDVHVGVLSFEHNNAIPSGGFPEWPKQAVVADTTQNDIIKKFGGRTFVERPSERVAVTQESFVVRTAPAAQLVFNGLAAIRNRAYRLFSHGVSPHVRGQGRALLTQRFRPVLISRIVVCSQ